jgi:hypothetical protein
MEMRQLRISISKLENTLSEFTTYFKNLNSKPAPTPEIVMTTDHEDAIVDTAVEDTAAMPCNSTNMLATTRGLILYLLRHPLSTPCMLLLIDNADLTSIPPTIPSTT